MKPPDYAAKAESKFVSFAFTVYLKYLGEFKLSPRATYGFHHPVETVTPPIFNYKLYATPFFCLSQVFLEIKVAKE